MKGPTAAEAAAFGLTLEEASSDVVEIWPDNLEAVNLFIQLSTQWRVGFSGPTGLDYAAVKAVFGMSSVSCDRWAEIFESIRTMEDAALKTMHKGT